MRRVLSIGYAVVAYVIFLGSFAGLVVAALGIDLPGVPAIDGTPRRSAPSALLIDIGLVLAFGMQHSAMARSRFKAFLSRLLPVELERSTFVLVSAVCVGFVVYLWAPIGGDVWNLRGTTPGLVLTSVGLAGAALVVVASFQIDHFELFGLKQVWVKGVGAPLRVSSFQTPLLYRVVRHPMMLGVLIAVWAAPRMSLGHFVFAAAMTLYIRIGVFFEERDLLRRFGEAYARYRTEVPMLFPRPRALHRSQGATSAA